MKCTIVLFTHGRNKNSLYFRQLDTFHFIRYVYRENDVRFRHKVARFVTMYSSHVITVIFQIFRHFFTVQVTFTCMLSGVKYVFKNQLEIYFRFIKFQIILSVPQHMCNVIARVLSIYVYITVKKNVN